jgi:hypothetical protein
LNFRLLANLFVEKTKNKKPSHDGFSKPFSRRFQGRIQTLLALQSLTDLKAQAQNPNRQLIFPNQPGTPLNNIIRRYNLQHKEAPAPYDCELDNHVTIEAIKAECIQRNVNFFYIT